MPDDTSDIEHLLRLSDLGDDVGVVRLGARLIAEGCRVEKDQEIAELATDKAVLTLGSPAAGFVHWQRVIGESLAEGQVILSVTRKPRVMSDSLISNEVKSSPLLCGVQEESGRFLMWTPRGQVSQCERRYTIECQFGRWEVSSIMDHGSEFALIVSDVAELPPNSDDPDDLYSSAWIAPAAALKLPLVSGERGEIDPEQHLFEALGLQSKGPSQILEWKDAEQVAEIGSATLLKAKSQVELVNEGLARQIELLADGAHDLQVEVDDECGFPALRVVFSCTVAGRSGYVIVEFVLEGFSQSRQSASELIERALVKEEELTLRVGVWLGEGTPGQAPAREVFWLQEKQVGENQSPF